MESCNVIVLKCFPWVIRVHWRPSHFEYSHLQFVFLQAIVEAFALTKSFSVANDPGLAKTSQGLTSSVRVSDLLSLQVRDFVTVDLSEQMEFQLMQFHPRIMVFSGLFFSGVQDWLRIHWKRLNMIFSSGCAHVFMLLSCSLFTLSSNTCVFLKDVDFRMPKQTRLMG